MAKSKALTSILHSMKSEDILISGCSVIKSLADSSYILDIGCNAGYLSSFYSKAYLKTKVIGYDTSYKAIELAKKTYKKKQYQNLSFTSYYNIIQNFSFDFIVDTQCLCTLNSDALNSIIIKIIKILNKFGKIVSVSNLRNEVHARLFISIFLKNNLYIESISEIIVNTIYGRQAYTKIVITKFKNNHIIDLDNYYKNLRKKVSLLQVFDLI